MGAKSNNMYEFKLISEAVDCGIVFYDALAQRELCRSPFTPEEKEGTVYRRVMNPLELKALQEYEDVSSIGYQFYEGDKLKADFFGQSFFKPGEYGEAPVSEDMLLAKLTKDTFSWKKDKHPAISYKDTYFYGLHVRGFTKDSSSKVKHPGAFLGVCEKISHFKELGVNALVLQPIYEFIEYERITPASLYEQGKETMLNYWGYKKGFYFAPKAQYASGSDPVYECKEMIRRLHQENIEVLMQIYFPEAMPVRYLLQILDFWVNEYHVDGFQIMGNHVPAYELANDPLLSHTKLILNEAFGKSHAAYMDYQYMETIRRFVKGDEGMLPSVAGHMVQSSPMENKIIFLGNYNTFTLLDNVSYDRKHNEENGENNADGNDYNFSWNCGEEGPSKRKKINGLRYQLIKNQLAITMMSQGIPYIFMGDEFGRSCNGNNNPYCHDTPINWLDWRNKTKHKELFQFVKAFIEFRRSNAILSSMEPFKRMDYLGCGYPDISFHGEEAWKPAYANYDRTLGIMYCGAYALKNRTHEKSLYFAMNMHWETHSLGLPALPRGYVWECVLKTTETGNFMESEEMAESSCVLPPRSIYILQAKEVRLEKKGKGSIK